MIRHRLLLTALLTIIPLATLMATPTLQLFQPPPGQYNIEQLWRARVTNPDNTTYESWFEGFVYEASQGQVFYARTKKFQLPTGTRIYMYRDVQIEHTDNAPGYERFAAQTGGLPPGTYTFVLLLNAFGISDTVSFEVKPMSPPRLIAPRDGDTVTTPYPQFVWTPPSPASPGVTYDLKLAEVMQGQTPEEALLANKPWLVQSRLSVTSLKYPTSARALDKGKAYAWQVAATSRGAEVGKSEVRTIYAGTIYLPPPGPVTATIVWQHMSADWDIWYSDYSSGTPGVVSTPKSLCNMAGNDMDPAVAYDRSGNTWVVWSHCDPGPNQNYRILWSRRLAGQAAWSTPQAVGSIWLIADQMDPALAFDDNGSGFCVWATGWSDLAFLASSFWNGAAWLAPTFDGHDTSRLPEITFTAAPATGANPATAHSATVIVVSGAGATARMGCTTWDGSVWTPLTSLPSPGGVIVHPYPYLSNNPAPDHVTIAALKSPIGHCYVTAAWTRQTATPQTSLLACNGYLNPAPWTWQTFPNWFNGTGGTTYHDPAVAVDGNNKSQNVFCCNNLIYCKHDGGSCGLLAAGSSGLRPVIAWVTGTFPGALAAWPSPSLTWTFWNSSAWTTPTVLQTGQNANPDVAARSGSHTMPPW